MKQLLVTVTPVSLARSIGRNTLLQIIGKGIATILGFVTVAMLQRALGTATYGAYTTVMAYTGFFSVIADLGLYLIVLREIAKPGADKEKILGNALSLRIIAALVLLGVGVAASFFFPYSRDIQLGIVIISVSFFFVAIQQVLVSVFQHALHMVSVVVGEIAGRIILLAGVAYFAAHTPTLWNMLYAVVAGSVVNMLVVLIRSRGFVKLRLRKDYRYWIFLLHETWPIAISIVLNLLYFRLDTIFLSVFRSLEEVGLYGAAYKILEILVTFPNMFIGLVMPVLSAVAFTNWDRFRVVFQRAFDVLMMGAIPLLIGGLILAEPLIVFVGGNEYAAAAPFFRILIVAVLFLFFGSLSGYTVTAINEQRRMVWAYLSVAILGIVLYLILIPLYGAYGAAIGTVVTEGSIMLAGFVMIWKRARVLPSFRLFGKVLACSLVMGGVLYFSQSLHVIISAVLGAAVYIGCMFASKAIDVSMLKTIISKEE
ncbi:MAG: flippase [Patescibacteria group bacterium]